MARVARRSDNSLHTPKKMEAIGTTTFTKNVKFSFMYIVTICYGYDDVPGYHHNENSA